MLAELVLATFVLEAWCDRYARPPMQPSITDPERLAELDQIAAEANKGRKDCKHRYRK